MRLVFITQAIDADDPNLAATIDMVRALARRCERVDVVCDRVRSHDLPVNVSFRTFAAPRRSRRGLRFKRAIFELLRERPRPNAIVTHMCPIYLILAAPLAAVYRVPQVIWYTHWDNDWTLRVATPLCAAALSVDKRSYPIASDKLRPIGHGIDMDRFAGLSDEPATSRVPVDNGSLRLLALGRTEPWKGLTSLLEGFELAAERGLDATLEIRGPQINESERKHRAELAELIEGSPTLRRRVSLEDAVTRDRVPTLLRTFDALVSPTRGKTTGGALDKVVYEASGCSVPVIACNPVLEGHLDGLPVKLRYEPDDPEDLASTLLAFAGSDPETRVETGRLLRDRAEQNHSVGSWADRVLATIRELH